MTSHLPVLRELELRLTTALYEKPRRTARLRRLAAAGVLVAAAAAAVAVLGLAGSGGAASSAAAVLDRAAHAVALRTPAAAPLGSGQFWYTRISQVERFPVPIVRPFKPPVIGPASPPAFGQVVWVTQRLTTETWIGRTGTIRRRMLPVGPPSFATPSDRARLLAAGLSPSDFVHASDSTTQGDGYFPPGQELFRYAALQRLPTEAHALYARITRALALAQARAQRELAATRAQIPASSSSSELEGIVIAGSAGAGTLWAIESLLESPVSAPVRAALYRAAALIPGVHVERSARDPLGRAGVGIATGPPPTAFELILDPRTGALLGQRGRFSGDSATLATGVTDSIDALPAGVAPIPGPTPVALGVTPVVGGPRTTFTITVGPAAGDRSVAFAVLGPTRPSCQTTLLPRTPDIVPSTGRALTYRAAPPAGGDWCRGDYQVQVTAFGHASGALGSVHFRVG